MSRTIHGHYGTWLEKEADRIRKEYSEKLGIKISWREATDLAALRSFDIVWSEKKLRDELRKLRGVL